MVKLAIFDLDGTLLDTIGDLAAACDAALLAAGMPRHAPDDYRRMVGNGIRNLVTRALPADRRDEATVEHVRRLFVGHYLDHIDLHTCPYKGIPELLSRLTERGVMLAVASNKFQAGTTKLVERFFPDIPFVAVFGQREGVPLKSDPHVDLEIMRAAGVSAAESLHIGDSAVDIATARAAGMRCVGVTWGFRPREELADADFAVDTPDELWKLFNDDIL